ncbi:hypothetical protein BCR44DRAFT_71013, partial [Catenaria anguillulae PL171]
MLGPSPSSSSATPSAPTLSSSAPSGAPTAQYTQPTSSTDRHLHAAAVASAAAMAKPKQKPIKLTELPDPPTELSFALQGQDRPLRLYRRQLIGTGGFARCYEALDNCRRRFALKVVNKVMIKNGKHAQKLRHEIRIQGRAKHPNIVELFGWKEDEDHVHILLELCPNRSLQEMVKARKRLTDHEARYFFKDLLLAVQYMHERNIIHRDLKLGNVFLSDDMHAKVGDFGLATEITVENERKKTICGTPNYIAPEILTGPQSGGHSFEVDIWSLGVILYSMLIGRPPFQTNDVNKIYKRINELDYSFPSSVPIHDDARALIESMLQREPERRPTIHDLLQHPYVNAPELMLEKMGVEALTEPPELPPPVVPVTVEPIYPSAGASLYQSTHAPPPRNGGGMASMSRSAVSTLAPVSSTMRAPYGHHLYNPTSMSSSTPSPHIYSDARRPSPPIPSSTASGSASNSVSGRHSPPPTIRVLSHNLQDEETPDAALVPPPSLARARSYGHMAASLDRFTSSSSSASSSTRQSRHPSPPGAHALAETGHAGLAQSVPHIAPSLESRGPSRSASHGSLASRYNPSSATTTSSGLAKSVGVPSSLSTSVSLASSPSPRPASVGGTSALRAGEVRTRSPGTDRFMRMSLEDRQWADRHVHAPPPAPPLVGASVEVQEAAVDEWHRRRQTRAGQTAGQHMVDEAKPRSGVDDDGGRYAEVKQEPGASMHASHQRHRQSWATAPREAAVRSRASVNLSARPSNDGGHVGGSALGFIDAASQKSAAPVQPVAAPATFGASSTPSTPASSASLIQSMQRNLAIAFQYAQDVTSPLADLKLEALRLHGADAQPPQVYLVKCIDYCDKYGIGYQLTNGVTGVYFNDSTVLARAPDKFHIEYLYQTRGGGGGGNGDTPPRRGAPTPTGAGAAAGGPTMKRQAHTMQAYPPDLEKKVTLLNHFCDYMDTHMVALPADQLDMARTRDLEFLIKFFRGRDEDPKCRDNVFRLSNQVFQMNFGDHSKLVLAQGGKMVLFIDSDRKKHIVQLADLGAVRKQMVGKAMVGPLASKELALKFWTRLGSVKDLVDRLWKKRIEAATARNQGAAGSTAAAGNGAGQGATTPSRAALAAVAAAVAESPAIVGSSDHEQQPRPRASARDLSPTPTPAMREARRATVRLGGGGASAVAAAAVPPRPVSVVGGGGGLAMGGPLSEQYGVAGLRSSAVAVGA